VQWEQAWETKGRDRQTVVAMMQMEEEESKRKKSDQKNWKTLLAFFRNGNMNTSPYSQLVAYFSLPAASALHCARTMEIGPFGPIRNQNLIFWPLASV